MSSLQNFPKFANKKAGSWKKLKQWPQKTTIDQRPHPHPSNTVIMVRERMVSGQYESETNMS
jgi:hypothetical protein